MTITFSIRNFYYKVIHFFAGKEYKGTNDFSGELVFFSEGKNYWNVFYPVLDVLIKHNKRFVYLTADREDPGLQIDSEYCSSHYLGNTNQAFFVLNKLKAKMCITTTPQLDILNWKRSKNVDHYCYLSHAPMDIHANKKFSFDYYDSALCGNDFHIANLRQLERDRNSRKKILMKTGCTYYDLKNEGANEQKEHILIAPTWGDRSFFVEHGELLLEKLLEHKHRVLYRPHPQSWISEKELLSIISSKFGKNELFEIDKRVDNVHALSKAKVLITDSTSGIIYDVAFLQKIPIIAVDFEWDDGGYESSDLENPPSTKYLLEDFGRTITENEIYNIHNIIGEVSNVKMTEEIIDKHIFNFQNAGSVAAKQILSIFKGLK
ncbi:CDP-glycerol glycerophosphotransferase family protein [Christiangramia gaetbulicola]|nr:CDP-glycerol glycerophosphotransferase family protein [Christiangramia gaetbulicola]